MKASLRLPWLTAWVLSHSSCHITGNFSIITYLQVHHIQTHQTRSTHTTVSTPFPNCLCRPWHAAQTIPTFPPKTKTQLLFNWPTAKVWVKTFKLNKQQGQPFQGMSKNSFGTGVESILPLTWRLYLADVFVRIRRNPLTNSPVAVPGSQPFVRLLWVSQVLLLQYFSFSF